MVTLHRRLWIFANLPTWQSNLKVRVHVCSFFTVWVMLSFRHVFSVYWQFVITRFHETILLKKQCDCTFIISNFKSLLTCSCCFTLKAFHWQSMRILMWHKYRTKICLWLVTKKWINKIIIIFCLHCLHYGTTWISHCAITINEELQGTFQ